ncbi:magnesium-dependent phosphatase 1-like isoform X2 [Thrips palmi]|nr:magnesium-dependent phosphatase 1-like isoform X2 [Thrips palmi]
MTLWPFRLDKHMRGPFSHNTSSKDVIDSCGQEVCLMEDSLRCLEYLKIQGYQIGVASRIKDISGAYQLINLLGIAPFFDYREIYPGCKKRHFHNIHHKSNLDFGEMIFFDDDLRNIRDVSSLGVTAIHVPEGITKSIVSSIC